jgi:uncharacterized protein
MSKPDLLWKPLLHRAVTGRAGFLRHHERQGAHRTRGRHLQPFGILVAEFQTCFFQPCAIVWLMRSAAVDGCANWNMNARLILMLKYPQPGEVKTRLIPALGRQRACELYRALVRHTLDDSQQFASTSGASLTARIAGAPDDKAVRQWLGDGIHFQPQGEGDLGRRMERAVQDAFGEGATSVVVIGADCPELAARHLDAAFRALKSNDVVVGPAVDGGYYLIGLRRFLPELFRDIPWSTDAVLEKTLVAANRAGVEYELLEILHDLDLPDDLSFWAQSQPGQASGKGGISVIIPAVNEAKDLRRILEAAQGGQPHEIIVVDGGSADETASVARSMDAIVLDAPRCRAVQMNRGAGIATGEYLLFLHADTLLPSDFAAQIRAVLNLPGVAGGAFQFSIGDDFAGRRLVETATNWRARRWQFPYGDQGLFVERQTFVRLGGFPEIPLMEDYEFVRRLRRLGRIVIAPSPAVTSGRRWQRLGWLRTALLNRAILVAYRLGVSPWRLAGWYRGPKAQCHSRVQAAPGKPDQVVGINRQPGPLHP